MLAALHTWSQTLAAHVHLHVLVTAGGLDANQRWQPAVKKCLLPRKVLMIVFRGKFRALVLKALQKGELTLPPPTSANYWIGEMNRLGRVPWNVKIFDRYEHGRGVVRYLARYLRGGPIGNHRLIEVRDGEVHFRYRMPSNPAADRTRQGVMCLAIVEFLRRFLEHVPPRGFQTVRGYGLYCGNQHAHLPEAFEALGAARPNLASGKLTVHELLEQLGIDTSANCCPVCGKELIIVDPYRRPYWRSARSPPREALVPFQLASNPA